MYNIERKPQSDLTSHWSFYLIYAMELIWDFIKIII